MVNGKYTDVEFSFEDNKITAHKCVLSARSPVFDAMFQHDFEEKKTNSVVIEDISYNTFLNMIKYIYTEVKPTMTYEETLELLVAADKVSFDRHPCKFIYFQFICSMIWNIWRKNAANFSWKTLLLRTACKLSLLLIVIAAWSLRKKPFK